MLGGAIWSGIFKRKAASAMSGVESSAKTRDNDFAFMLRRCSHSAGFAKRGKRAQNAIKKEELERNGKRSEKNPKLKRSNETS
jgi:hypothetical protein